MGLQGIEGRYVIVSVHKAQENQGRHKLVKG